MYANCEKSRTIWRWNNKLGGFWSVALSVCFPVAFIINRGVQISSHFSLTRYHLLNLLCGGTIARNPDPAFQLSATTPPTVCRPVYSVLLCCRWVESVPFFNQTGNICAGAAPDWKLGSHLLTLRQPPTQTTPKFLPICTPHGLHLVPVKSLSF